MKIFWAIASQKRITIVIDIKTMKILPWIVVLSGSCGLTSCADFFMPYDQNGSKGRDYQRGFAEGQTRIIRQKYWEEQNKPVETPALEKRYTPITVPEQTLPDGVITEQHTEYVETVQ